MSYVAEAELTIDAPPEHVFDHLADIASWPSWMPRSFALVPGSVGASPVRSGDSFRVKIAGMPVASTLRLSALDRPREVAWRGGLPGVLRAEHRFVLEAAGAGRTRVRSIETWSGALAGVTKVIVKRLAESIGRKQLAGLARAAQPAAR